MTRAEFAAKVRAQYPQYRGIPDDALVDAYLAKFPQYKDLVESGEKQGVLNTQGISTDSLVSGTPTSFNDDPNQQQPGVLSKLIGMMSSAAHPPNAGDSTLHKAGWLGGNALPVEGIPSMASMLPESVQGLLRGVRSGVGRAAEGVGSFVEDFNILHPLKPAGTLVRKAGEALSSPSNEEAISSFRGGSQPPVAPASVTVRPNTPDLIDKYRKPPVTGPTASSPVLRKAEGQPQSLEDVLQEMLSKGEGGGGSTFLPNEPTITDPATLRQSGTFPAGAKDANGLPKKLGQPGGYTSGRPSTTPQRFDEIDQTIPRGDDLVAGPLAPEFTPMGGEAEFNAGRPTEPIPDAAASAQDSLLNNQEIGMEGPAAPSAKDMLLKALEGQPEAQQAVTGGYERLASPDTGMSTFRNSQSRRTPRSTVPGAFGKLTENDIMSLEDALAEKLGVTPRITGIRPNPEANAVIEAGRKSRSDLYRSGAELDKSAEPTLEDYLNSLFNRRD